MDHMGKGGERNVKEIKHFLPPKHGFLIIHRTRARQPLVVAVLPSRPFLASSITVVTTSTSLSLSLSCNN